jgi:uncharacterized phage protein (TIGR02218 family)
MKSVSPALAADLNGEVTTLATCWRLERLDGWARGFTDHDRDLLIDGLAYVASTGFLPSAVKTGSDLSVDNLDVEGFLDDSALTPEELAAGLFDGARIEVFLVNWADLGHGRLILRKGFLGEVKRAPTSASRLKSAACRTACSRPPASSIRGCVGSISDRPSAASISCPSPTLTSSRR